MSTLTYAGTPVELDAEGFFQRPEQWSEAMAEEIAVAEGIAPLTERHWRVINFMRSNYLETGSDPPLRTLSKASDVPIRELYELFPTGPAKRLAAKIAGIPKPHGCL